MDTAQLANEVQLLRQNSSTFRALEAAAAAAGYKTIEIRMGAGLLPGDIADSTRTNSSTRTIRINSDATGSWGVGGRQATVGEVIAHELAHAVVPSQYQQPGVIDPQEAGSLLWRASTLRIRRSLRYRRWMTACAGSTATTRCNLGSFKDSAKRGSA
jgi:hypothetical protein